MNTIDFLENGNQVANPQWSKANAKKGVPKYLTNNDASEDKSLASDITDRIVPFSFTIDTGNNLESYSKRGVTFNPINTQEELDKERARNQSNMEKLGHSLVQTVVNELGLGLAEGVLNLAKFDFDLVSGKFFEDDYSFTNPALDKINEWKENIRKEYDIYREDPDADILNGGLTDFGWYMENAPSIISSLTLMIPSVGGTRLAGFTLSKLGKVFGVTSKLAKAQRSGSSLAKAARSLGTSGTTANAVVNTASTAGMSRILENYQEAAQTFRDTKDYVLEAFASKDFDKEQFIKDNTKDGTFLYDNCLKEGAQQSFERIDKIDGSSEFVLNRKPEDYDWNKIADQIAGRSARDDFKGNLYNFGFDFLQVYALRNFVKGFKNKNSSIGLEKAKEDLTRTWRNADAAAKELSKTDKLLRNARLLGKGAYLTASAEASEGIEEAINYIAQEKGLHTGKVLLGEATDDFRISSYLNDGKLWDSAFWGFIGGIVFQTAGSGFNKLSNKILHNKDKAEIQERKDNLERTMQGLDTWITQVEAIDKGYDIYNEKVVDTNIQKPTLDDKYNKFSDEDGDINVQKTRAKQRLSRDVLANIALDAAENGNASILRSMLNDENVKKQLIDAGVIETKDDNEFERYITEQLDKAENRFDNALTLLSSFNTNPNYAMLLASHVVRNQMELDKLNDLKTDLHEQIDKHLTDNPNLISPEDYRQYKTEIAAERIISNLRKLRKQKEQLRGKKDLNSIIKEKEIDEKIEKIENAFNSNSLFTENSALLEKINILSRKWEGMDNKSLDEYTKYVDEYVERNYKDDKEAGKNKLQTLTGVNSYGFLKAQDPLLADMLVYDADIAIAEQDLIRESTINQKFIDDKTFIFDKTFEGATKKAYEAAEKTLDEIFDKYDPEEVYNQLVNIKESNNITDEDKNELNRAMAIFDLTNKNADTATSILNFIKLKALKKKYDNSQSEEKKQEQEAKLDDEEQTEENQEESTEENETNENEANENEELNPEADKTEQASDENDFNFDDFVQEEQEQQQIKTNKPVEQATPKTETNNNDDTVSDGAFDDMVNDIGQMLSSIGTLDSNSDDNTNSEFYKKQVKKLLDTYGEESKSVVKKNGKYYIKLVSFISWAKVKSPNLSLDTRRNAFMMMRNFIIANNNNKGKDRFITLLDNEKSLFDDDIIDKTPSQIYERELSKNVISTDVLNVVKYLSTEEEFERFNKSFEALKPGDKLTYSIQSTTYGNNVVRLSTNGIEIAQLPLPQIEKDGTFVKSNDGWITDVKKVGNNVQSSFIDFLKENFSDIHSQIVQDVLEYSDATDKDKAEIAKRITKSEFWKKVKPFINNKVPSDERRIQGLVNLIKYSVSYDKNDIIKSYDVWKDKLYRTYDITSYLSTGGQNVAVTVNSINKGEVIRTDISEADFPKNAIVGLDTSVNCLCIADANDNIYISGTAAPYRGLFTRRVRRGNTFITIPREGNEPTFVRAYPIQVQQVQGEAKQFIDSCKDELYKLLYNFAKTGSEQDYNALADFVEMLFPTNTSKISPFRTLGRELKTVLVSQRGFINFDLGEGISCAIGKTSRTGNKTTSFSYTKGNDKQIYSFSNKGVVNTTNIKRLVLSIFNRYQFQITDEYIKNDSYVSNNTNGIFSWNKDTKKLKIKIGNYEKEYNGYSEFLVSNNLVKVATKKINESNFLRPNTDYEGKIFKPQLEVAITTDNSTISTEEEIDIPTPEEPFDKILKRGNKPLLEKILTNIFNGKKKLKDLRTLDKFFDLFNESVIFVNEKLGTDEKPIEAKTITGDNKKYPKGTIIIGQEFKEIYEKSNSRAALILIHESLHRALIDNDGTVTNKIKKIRNEFIASLNNDNYIEEFAKTHNITKEKAKTYLNKFVNKYNNEEANLEEFLIESITNKSLIDYLNIVDAEVDTIDEENMSIWQKLIKYINELFGLTTRKNSLREKEFYSLSDAFTETEDTGEPGDYVDENDGYDYTNNYNSSGLFSNVGEIFVPEIKYNDELEEIKNKAISDGTFMKAPNGNPTNLNEHQWLQVRTKAFKDWFGDWINDPTNASKVVDENGEPKVVYHGSDESFNIFDTTKKRYNVHNKGIFFTDTYEKAKTYGRYAKAVFLNIKNPVKNDIRNESDINIIELRKLENTLLNDSNYDGAMLITFDKEGQNTPQYVAYQSNQVKSATENNGDFSLENDDIRYSNVGELDSQNIGNLDNYVSSFEPAQRAEIRGLFEAGSLQISCR